MVRGNASPTATKVILGGHTAAVYQATMDPLWRNSLEVVAAVGAVAFGTLIIHFVMSW